MRSAILWLLGILPVHLLAGTYTANSCNQADVNAVINGPTHTAVDGDVIQIPMGTCTWAAGIFTPLGIGITIAGSGTPNNSVTTFGPNSSCTATKIIDNIISPAAFAFVLQPAYNSSLIRLSCMEFLGNATGANSIYSPIAIQGTCNSSTCAQVRLDNVTFDGSLQTLILNSQTAIVSDNVFGVLDHNFEGGVCCAVVGMEFINVNHSAIGGVGAYGDNSWVVPDSFGTANTLYVENNAFGNGVLISEAESAVENGGQGGGRIAARFNTCTGCVAGISGHGLESNGRPRGVRQLEFYGNTLNCVNNMQGCQGAVPIRSGVSITFGNAITVSGGAYYNNYVAFATYRTLAGFSPWGGCDGSSPYDTNDGVVYASGTMTSVSISSTTAVVTDTTKTWTANQWIPAGAPYAIHDVTTNNGVQLTSNTVNTATGNGWTSPPNFNTGDSYQILRATVCLDQPNRGVGALLQGATPVLASTGMPGPGSEVLDPAYEWDDSGYNPVFGNVSVSSGLQMLVNRDWYTDNSAGTPHIQTSPTMPFNGTSGVGFGTLANRPATCTAGPGGTKGVGYFVTDQGSWNQSGNSFGQGQLYVCNPTNMWSLYYTPYTYPHPLIGSTPPPPTSGGYSGTLSGSFH